MFIQDVCSPEGDQNAMLKDVCSLERDQNAVLKESVQ